jgi:rhodanese-related sulfurtransferase
MHTGRLALFLAACVATAAVAAEVATVTPDTLLERQRKGDEALLVLDVRTPEEFASGHVPGAVNIPYDQLPARIGEVPRDKDVVLYCRTGRRAALAAEVLAGQGYVGLGHLEGDIQAWVAQGRVLDQPKDAAACVAALKAEDASPAACATL